MYYAKKGITKENKRKRNEFGISTMNNFAFWDLG